MTTCSNVVLPFNNNIIMLHFSNSQGEVDLSRCNHRTSAQVLEDLKSFVGGRFESLGAIVRYTLACQI